MWIYEKKLQYPVNIKNTNPALAKFIISQLAAMCVLLSTTWLVQQLIILYFWWYVITNHLTFTPELRQFSAGASYSPSLLAGMFFAAVCSYLIMRKFVFNSKKRNC